MLYATTRNNSDVFTAQRVLTMKRGSDGGLFVPYRIPRFSESEIRSLGDRNFNSNLADILNLLFGSRLTGYDIDFAMGRYSVRLQQLAQRIIMGESWHNTDWHFSRMVRDLSTLVLSGGGQQPELKGWAEIGVRIGVLFGMFGELIRAGLAGTEKTVDIAMVSGDFSAPMAAWYARAMGLPIGNIVCCCNENGSLWDFICHGQLRTDGVARKTVVPEGDVAVPESLERLISVYGGPSEVERYVQALRRGCTYYADDGFLQRLRQGIYVTVSSERRVLSTIPSAYSTHGYLLALSSALAYAGLQDYRARTGELRTALIFTEKSPALDQKRIGDILGISGQELEKRL